MRLLWEEEAWEDYCLWQTRDKKLLKRINTLLKDIQRNTYEGIGKPLEALQQEGRELAVASSKPERFVREILEHFGIGQYFSEIVGATMDEKLSSKPDIIREVFRRGKLTQADKASVVMIGDRRFDIEGANETGLDSIGVYYGFAEPGELEKAGATYIAETVQNLADLFRRI